MCYLSDNLQNKPTFNFFKNPVGFFPHYLKWEKNPAGEKPCGGDFFFALEAHNDDKHFLCHFKSVFEMIIFKIN